MSRTAAGTNNSSAVSPLAEQQECLSCRVIGSGALGAVGLYALHQARAHQPGSVVGKRIMAGMGVCFLAAGYVRWNATQPRTQPQPVAKVPS